MGADALATGVGLVLLAAGQAVRFGGDKLMAPLAGQPLLSYAARLGAGLPWRQRLAVVSPQQDARAALLRAAGWQVYENPRAGLGQGSSLAVAAQVAQELGCRGLLVCLADMPAVSDALLLALLQTADSCDAAVCGGPQYRGPPTYFAGRHLPLLSGCVDDRAGSAVLRSLTRVARCAAPAEQLVDVDTPESLLALEQRWQLGALTPSTAD